MSAISASRQRKSDQERAQDIGTSEPKHIDKRTMDRLRQHIGEPILVTSTILTSDMSTTQPYVLETVADFRYILLRGARQIPFVARDNVILEITSEKNGKKSTLYENKPVKKAIEEGGMKGLLRVLDSGTDAIMEITFGERIAARIKREL